jgi:hypothetical protein
VNEEAQMNAVASLSAGALQARERLLEEPIPWMDRKLSAENLKALLLARLPTQPTGRDVEQLFSQLGLSNAGRQGDLIDVMVPAARDPWWLPTRPYWLLSAFVNSEDQVTSFKVQYLSGL